MRVSEAFPSKYLGAEDLGGKPAAVRISNVVMEMVSNEKKMIISFVGRRKTMVCNKTNATKISEILSDDDTDRWFDRVIELYPAEVDFKGETVQAIRVRAPRTETRQPDRDQRRDPPRDDRDDRRDPPRDREIDDRPPPRQVARPAANADMDDDIPF
jgi:hypothetical protein